MRSRIFVGTIGLAFLAAAGLGASAWDGQRGLNARWSGTYELDTNRGDNPERVVDYALRRLAPDARTRANQNLVNRLQPPQVISIDRNGRNVTIASSEGPRMAFNADGIPHRESGPMGRAITTRASLNGQQLVVSTSGNRNNDFTVTFEPLNNGNTLLVTRRLDSADLTQPVQIQSYYRRTSTDPRWDVYTGPAYGGGGAPAGYDRDRDRDRNRGGTRSGDYIPEGTRLTARLDTPLSTRSSRDGDRFTLTVTSPSEYSGARIDGVIARRDSDNNVNEGHDIRVSFTNFQTRNGRSADFWGNLESVRLPDGSTLHVDTEGGVSEKRTDKTVGGGAIGAGLGAIIGAIAGGGKGAAIGAVVGGGGGAIVGNQAGRDFDLPAGSELTIVAMTPRGTGL